MKKIKLTRGYLALVDDKDFDFLNQFNWQYQKDYNTGYASRRVNKKHIKMHQAILTHSNKLQTDHINGNGLDNRRSNLRLVTNSQNCMNRGLRNDNTSGYKGVSFFKTREKWIARICLKSKNIFLGHFKTSKEAAIAYNQAAIKYFGTFARINNI